MKPNPASVLLALLLTTAVAPAQQLGITGRYGIGLLEGGRMTDAWRTWCDCRTAGEALTQQALFSATLLYGADDSPFAGSVGVGIGTAVSRFISRPYPTERTDLPAGSRLEYREDLASIALRVDVDALYRVSGPASLVAGPWIEYLAESRTDRTERIVAPPGSTFPGEGAERNITDEPTEPSPLRWGLGAGVALSLDVTPGVRVMPQLVVETDLSRWGDSSPGVLVLAAGSAVVIDMRSLFREDRPSIVPPSEVLVDATMGTSAGPWSTEGSRNDTAKDVRPTTDASPIVVQPAVESTADGSRNDAQPDVPRSTDATPDDVQSVVHGSSDVATLVPRPDVPHDGSASRDELDLQDPRVSVDIFVTAGDERSAVAVVRREVVLRRVVAALPSELPVEDRALETRRNVTMRFTLDSLVGVDPRAIDDRTIDIIGLRMRSRRATRLVLVGARGRDEAPGTGRSRARMIGDYLVGGWGIARDRIELSEVESTDDARGIVRLESASRSLLAPVVVEWLDERFVLPSIGVDPTVDAPRGVFSSRLWLMRNRRLIATAGVERPTTLEHVAVNLADVLEADTAAPIVAILDVTDSAGVSVSATDALAIDLPPRSRRREPSRTVTTLVLQCGSTTGNDVVLDELGRIGTTGAIVRLRVPQPSDAAMRRDAEAIQNAVREAARRAGLTLVEIPDDSIDADQVVVEIEIS